ncbi:MAG: FliH/SctL family protein [Legionellales bacterium]
MAKLFKKAEISTEVVYLNDSQAIQPVLLPEQPALDLIEVEIKTEAAYQKGYLLGKDEANAMFQQQMALLKQQLEALIASIPPAIAANKQQLNTEIADTILLVCQQFFIEKQQNGKALEQQIHHILSQISNQQTLELCLHPQDLTALKQGAIQINAAHLSGLKIKSDESLRLGGCLIKTEHGLFDASIEKQIDRLKEVLLQIRQDGMAHATPTV